MENDRYYLNTIALMFVFSQAGLLGNELVFSQNSVTGKELLQLVFASLM